MDTKPTATPQDEIIIPAVNEQTESPAALFVSLYLIVLVFFILLNSLSMADLKKTEAAVKSVQQQFSATHTPYFAHGIEYDMPTGPASSVRNFFTQASDILAFDSVDMYVQGNELRATIPVNSVFEGGKRTLRPQQKVFLDKLTALLTAPIGDYRVEVEFLIGSVTYLKGKTDISEEEVGLEMARAGEFARALTRKGVSPASITIGVSTESPKNFTLSFHLREINRTLE